MVDLLSGCRAPDTSALQILMIITPKLANAVCHCNFPSNIDPSEFSATKQPAVASESRQSRFAQ